MPFNELRKGTILPDPEQREPEDLKFSNKRRGKNFLNHYSSVSARTIRWTLILLGTMFAAALISGIFFIFMKAYRLYVTN